jgi:hypothetical protein
MASENSSGKSLICCIKYISIAVIAFLDIIHRPVVL